MTKSGCEYEKAGVNLDLADRLKDGLKARLKRASRPEVIGGVGGFGGLFALDLKKWREPVLVSSMDGVGTKLRVAVQMGIHDTVGEDLVNHCCDDLVAMGAEPLFFLDYIGTGKLEAGTFEAVISGFVSACAKANVALLGGETAQMPGFYGDGEYDLVGTIVGCVERSQVIDGRQVRKGDALIGLPSSGLHTNGYSLARSILFDKLRLGVDSRVEELGATVGQELLKVHVNYAPLVLELLRDFPGAIHAIAHITGGGFSGNIPRVLPAGMGARIRRGSWPVLPVFKLLQKQGGVSDAEMAEVFNLGIGMVLVADPGLQDRIVEKIRAQGLTPHLIGEIVPDDSSRVLFD